MTTADPVLTVVLDQRQDWLTSNDRDAHWARRSTLTKFWRQQACARTQVALSKIPGGLRLDRARIVATVHKPTRHLFDPGNLAPTVKAAVDGMVADAGLLPGDDFRYLDGPDYRARPGSPHGRRIVLDVYALPADDQGVTGGTASHGGQA